MAIIVTAKPYMEKWDPVTQTRVDRSPQLASNARVPFPFYDGRLLWIARMSANTTISAYDETGYDTTQTFTVTSSPTGIFGDQRFLYAIYSGATVRAYDIESAGLVYAFNLPNTTYTGLTGDGRFMWTISNGANQVQKFDPEQGTVIETFTPPSNSIDLHYDGRFLWIYTGADSVQGKIHQYDPVVGTEIDNFNVTNFGLSDQPGGLCGDGRYLYAGIVLL